MHRTENQEEPAEKTPDHHEEKGTTHHVRKDPAAVKATDQNLSKAGQLILLHHHVAVTKVAAVADLQVEIAAVVADHREQEEANRIKYSIIQTYQ
jgi:hypothetical protein